MTKNIFFIIAIFLVHNPVIHAVSFKKSEEYWAEKIPADFKNSLDSLTPKHRDLTIAYLTLKHQGERNKKPRGVARYADYILIPMDLALKAATYPVKKIIQSCLECNQKT